MFGRYRMLGRIASGGMAEVWAAQLLATGGFCKNMVIKRVLPELASNPQFLRMLMTEARVAARLSHTNICAVFELGEVDGEHYIAMEYLRGAPLTTLLKSGGGLDPAAAIAIVVQACDGLHYAHEQRDAGGNLLQLVHRDVSPHNLFVTVDGIVKVLDFGIAKVDDGSSERTEAGKVKGKLAYMSPEQLAAGDLDRRSDVWSLGCVLWELLTGRRLFAGGPAQTIDAIRNARVPALAAAGVDLPQLDDVIARAICKNREWRYATAADLRKAMVEALPVAPAQNDAVAKTVWARCGTIIRAQDKRFDEAEEDTVDEPGVVDRLPLRAGNTTQVSQEIYINDGVEPTNLSAVLARFDDPPVQPEVYTSPDLPSNRPAPDSASMSMPRRSRWPLVIALVAVAAVIGMALGVLVPSGTKKAAEGEQQAQASLPPTEQPKPEAPKSEQPKPEQPKPEQPEPEINPIEVQAVPPTPAPEQPPVAEEPKQEPKQEPKAKVEKTTPKTKAVKTKVVEVARSIKSSEEKQAPGKLSIDAQPWATIYVDGAKKGPTPIPNLSLAAGDHTVKAVTQDGRTKTIKIHVAPGATVRRKVTW
jgi:serine/threonine protein kinase